MGLSEEDKIAWIGADGRAAMAAVFALDRYEHFTLVGKSLGTAAMAAAAPDEPRLASADLIWLTPGFKTHGVLQGMSRCLQRSIIVIGMMDPHYEETHIVAARARRAELVEMRDLDHRLEKPGDVAGSLVAMTKIVERLAAWLDISEVAKS
jgi:sugar (pentulose or hexulose) kinase